MPTFTAGTNKGQGFDSPDAWNAYKKDNMQFSQDEVNRLLGMGFSPTAFEQVDNQWYVPNAQGSNLKNILSGNIGAISSTGSITPGAPATSPASPIAPSTSPSVTNPPPVAATPTSTPTPTMNFTPQNITELAASNKFKNLYGDFGARRMGFV